MTVELANEIWSELKRALTSYLKDHEEDKDKDNDEDLHNDEDY